MELETLFRDSRPFLVWLVDWYNGLSALSLVSLVEQAGGPDRVAVMAVDVTQGFCSQGALSSKRVGGIVAPIVRLFEQAWALGIRHFVLPQDTHSSDAVEFSSFPPHCMRGTGEPVTVPDLMALTFSDKYLIIEKDSISSAIGTELDDWLHVHPGITLFVVVGDCTDFCVYQLAMHLRLRANAFHLGDVRVVVPVDGVDTFDTPVEVARQIGALPHHADLMHLVFLFSMAQNGVEIARTVV